MATQPVVLRITHQNILNTSTKFLPDELAGFNVDVQFEDAVGAEAFGVAIGDYDVVTATASGWTLYAPPGSSAVLSGNIGTVADPKSFLLDAPNRYLVELVATAFIDDGGGTPTLVGATPDRITALVEVADGNILFGGGVASMPAARETDEYDSATGWSGSGMAYFIALSKMMGGNRQLMNAVNSNGAQIDQYKVVTNTTVSAMEPWHGANASDDPDEYQNHLIRMIGVDATDANLLTKTLGLCMRTAADGVRTSYLMSGFIPFDVTGAGWNLGDLLYVSSNAGAAGDIVTTPPGGGGDVVRPVGYVVSDGTDTAANPGVIYFNGVDQHFLPLRLVGGNAITIDFDSATGQWEINWSHSTMWYLSTNRLAAFLDPTTGLTTGSPTVALTSVGVKMIYEMPNPASGITHSGDDEVYKLMHELALSFATGVPVDVECILRGSDTLPATFSLTDIQRHALPICDPFMVRSAVATGDTQVALPEIRTLSRYLFLEVIDASGTPATGTAVVRSFSEFDEEKA